MVVAVPAQWWGGGERVPTAVACEGNKNLPSDLGQKVGPEFIVLSISSGSTWNRC
jgi:hypothetical protein